MSSYTFNGSGWGHGLGLGQYGARGAAEAGKSFAEILTHFYQNTSVGSYPMPGEIRVGLIQGTSQMTISGNGRFDFAISGSFVASGGANENWTVSPSGGGAYTLRAPDGRHWTLGDSGKWLEVHYEPFGTLLRATGHQYKYGWLELNTHTVNGSWAIRAIMHVAPFEKYLYGLGEMPSSWHLEALKAQAAAGRTYAVEKMNRLGIRAECNCHLYSTTFDQAYVGYDKEIGSFADRWRSAVDSTAGQVVKHNGAPIQAYYSSSSGGHTEHNENVWGGSPIPYLRGVPDPWDLSVSPHLNWSVPFTAAQLENKLNSSSSTSVGTLQSVEILEPRGVSGRVARVIDANSGGVRITGSNGVKRVSGDTLRSVLGLKSTLFNITLTSLGHPNGTFVKGSAPEVYRVVAGAKMWVISPSVFTSHSEWGEIVGVPDAEIAGYREPRLGYEDGSLLRDPRDGKIYVVTEGALRHIQSIELFVSLGYDSFPLIAASPEELALHPVVLPWTDSSRHPHGTFVRAGSDPQVWRIEHGRKRRVLSESIFFSWASEWGEVISISAQEMATYPEGAALGFRDGTLVGSHSAGKVWVISDGLRRFFTSGQGFEAMGFSWKNVRWVSDQEIEVNVESEPWTETSRHPNGTFVKGSAPEVYRVVAGAKMWVISPSVFTSHAEWGEIVGVPDAEIAGYREPRLGYEDGSLLRDPRDGKIYVVTEGALRHIQSIELFVSLGYDSFPLIAASPEELALHPVVLPWTDSSRHPHGTFVRAGSDPQVWRIEHGRKRRVLSEAIFFSWAEWEEVASISAAEMAAYPEGEPLGFRDGSLVGQTSTGKVWVISDGLRRFFTSGQGFEAMGFSWKNVRWVSDQEIEVNSEGQAVP